MNALTAWLIVLFPLGSFVLIGLFLHRFRRLSAALTIGAIAASGALSVRAFDAVLRDEDHLVPLAPTSWLRIGEFEFALALQLDALTAVMLLVVTSVSLLVQVYSTGYMSGDRGFARYFAFMSLFTASMLGLVLADNLVLVYVFWELVGLCSYLLIGHWYERPAAAAAAKKAFIVTRLGDFGFLIAVLLLYANNPEGTLSIARLSELAMAGALTQGVLVWASLGIFSGAVGKSAQFPLHVWLPDAMEGPTPVSALIHAATMVAAGVYLVARTFPIFAQVPGALDVVAVIGGFTAIFAASMGLVATDMKRVLAYSTISQLGYMMLALGVGAYAAAIFHLMNHAFFKALLFLGSGSVHHAVETYDIRYMGGLWRAMPFTFVTFVIASLSIAGIIPFSGFWSKDEILHETLLSGQTVLFVLALITVFMTAFYMFRLCFLAFGGTYRGGSAAEAAALAASAAGGSSAGHAPAGAEHGHPHLHESPAVMVLPLVILAIPSIFSGIASLPEWAAGALGIAPHALAEFLATPPPVHAALGDHAPAPYNWGLAALSLATAAAGIVLAWLLYGLRLSVPRLLVQVWAPVHTALANKYWFDELYQSLVDYLLLGLAALLHWFDSYVVDGIVNGVGALVRWSGRSLRYLQTGHAPTYGMAFLTGMLLLLVAFLLRGS